MTTFLMKKTLFQIRATQGKLSAFDKNIYYNLCKNKRRINTKTCIDSSEES